MTDSGNEWQGDLIAAVASLTEKGPARLLKRVNVDRDDADEVTPNDLVAFLNDDNQQSSTALLRLTLALSDWDFAIEPVWDKGDGGATEPRTEERRQRVYELLGIPDAARVRLSEIAPVATMRTAVISLRWKPWYTEERRIASALYWPHYRDHLLKQPGWSGESVAALDDATDQVVQRLSDPSSDDSYQSKGLVVGYVQSGKTANFAGVIAKAIDAGYRLIIVMTGTIELLRSQTQRRLDRELVGQENLTRGLDPESAEEFDYADDPDWQAGRFISHGNTFHQKGYPAIERLTFLNDDYQRLRQGLTRMNFPLVDRSKRFYEPENLMPADARIAVVKKNKTVLAKLAKDLKPLRDKLADIPALIIDDESDLASVNTKNPEKTSERTAINKAISDLLRQLPRGQLVMYTATPFANFFVDPDDNEDVFPRNFIISLDRPPNYMGVADFHDIDWNTEDPKSDPATSNERAYVRKVGPPPDFADEKALGRRKTEMLDALDAFVLSGALKLYRANADGIRVRHHTMMVHESTKNAEQKDQADLIREVWAEAAYHSPQALSRLRKLWDNDYEPVCRARAGKYSVPGSFDELKRSIGEALRRINEMGDPVLIVNGDADVQRNQQALDFDRNDVWRILVGGAKLSRGFTVEGLTISFYTRKALQADTLMQAGRWFGYRDGYRDLVRLFIRRDPDDAIQRVDLYEAFEGLMRDEMALRESLEEYEGFDENGDPILEPWQVPPIVSQHLPYLRPSARNKMFNAEIHTKGDAGRLKDYYGIPPRSSGDEKRLNFELWAPILASAIETKSFQSSRRKAEERTPKPFTAKVGTVAISDFLTLLDGLNWDERFRQVIDPTRRFYHNLAERGGLTDLVILWPQLTSESQLVELPGIGQGQVVTRQRREEPRIGFVGSDAKHRDAAERIAGAAKANADPVADALRDPARRRAALLVYVAADPVAKGAGKATFKDLDAAPDAKDLAVLMSLVAPSTATTHGKSVIEWTVRRPSLRGTAAVPK
ncbi:Z1 domain-containing protein [Mycolicibacterium gilvum]|uniref:Z1 domain-containing protein n=1 Tax=Mycolicibacterium gilvum (strain DSM 45189 / LMG 24558 / Spyr1) TaxID=278137 RepID=E6TDI5_MYCSR|nr:Z1 domain-containing protein [Mycolicibacterium gilvum]ADT97565.1 Z1 domain-containing protein [Mycolicibacterium gilvum Spyr1]